MKVVVGLSLFTSERSNKNSRTQRCCDCAIFRNGLCIGKKRVTDAIDVCCRPPCMNALCAADLMRWRAIPAVCANKYRRIDFSPEVLQESGKQKDRARDIMGELF